MLICVCNSASPPALVSLMAPLSAAVFSGTHLVLAPSLPIFPCCLHTEVWLGYACVYLFPSPFFSSEYVLQEWFLCSIYFILPLTSQWSLSTLKKKKNVPLHLRSLVVWVVISVFWSYHALDTVTLCHPSLPPRGRAENLNSIMCRPLE